MNFSSIPGMPDVKKFLTDAVKNNHAAHAVLFAGAEGTLNLPMAVAYATYLHCQNRGDNDSCGVCPACSKNLKFIHPDTHFVFPLNNIKGDKDEERFKSEILKSWRSFLTEQPFGSLDDWTNYYGGEDKLSLISREESREIVKTLSLKPFESPHKVMIIWKPELMHPSAANGILKILEEPANHTYFILVTNAVDRLLPTIISRTQIVTIPLLHDQEVIGFLKQQGTENARAGKIARLADGNLTLALKMTEQEEDDSAQRFVEWMRVCFKRNYQTMVSMADDYHSLDKLSQRNLMAYSLNMMRETLLNVSEASELHRAQEEELKFITDFSKVMNLKKIETSYKLINDASYHLERNGSAKMIFLDLSLKLAETIHP